MRTITGGAITGGAVAGGAVAGSAIAGSAITGSRLAAIIGARFPGGTAGSLHGCALSIRAAPRVFTGGFTRCLVWPVAVGRAIGAGITAGGHRPVFIGSDASVAIFVECLEGCGCGGDLLFIEDAVLVEVECAEDGREEAAFAWMRVGLGVLCIARASAFSRVAGFSCVRRLLRGGRVAAASGLRLQWFGGW